MKLMLHGRSLVYEEAGHGQATIFVHGYPLDHTMWKPQLQGLRVHVRCIAPDLRGFGESEGTGESSSMDDFASDLVGLMDELRVERAALCGLSMGGYVALAFAEHWPDRLSGLVLANTRSGADSEAAREARLKSATTAQEQGADAIVDGLLPRMLAESTRAQRPEVSEQVRQMMARQPVSGIAGALRGMAGRPDRTSVLSRIRCPALVITGSADALIPPSESEAMAAAIPGAKLVIIPEAGHLSNLEQPEAFNAALREFFLRLR